MMGMRSVPFTKEEREALSDSPSWKPTKKWVLQCVVTVALILAIIFIITYPLRQPQLSEYEYAYYMAKVQQDKRFSIHYGPKGVEYVIEQTNEGHAVAIYGPASKDIIQLDNYGWKVEEQ